MKLTRKQIDELNNDIKSGNPIEIDYSAKCDLCEHRFDAVHKFPTMKAECPNCGNEVYTDAFD